MDSNRALNYAATTASETMGNMSRTPWIGPRGTFKDPKWASITTEVWDFVEYEPVYVTDETTGAQQLAPPPTKNLYETSIQWMISLGQWFSDHIKATTAIYDPSLGQQKGDQSGRAIEQLRSESSVGNYSYADNLHRAIEVMYDQMCCIFPKILDGQRVVTIVKPTSQHEIVEINREFPGNGIDPATGKKGKANNICIGEYSVRVQVGPSNPTRELEAIQKLSDAFKSAPQALQNPAVLADYIRALGDGNPMVNAIADQIHPADDGEANPQQMQQALQQSQQQNQQLMQVAQRLAAELKSKLPELEYKKWSDALKATTQIRVAEITASKDLDNAQADREAALLGQMLGFAHDVGTQAADHEHEQGMQQQQAERDAQSQMSDQAHQAGMQENQNEAAKEQAAAQEGE
jgi:hypothetical protein